MNATVRTFRAPTPRAALEAVKAALGDEAVILETREVKAGLWGRAEIEVTAASPADPPPPSREGVDRPPSRKSDGPETFEDLDKEVAALRRIIEELRAELRSPRPEPRGTPAVHVPPEAMRLYRRLVARGVEDGTAEELVRQALREASDASRAALEEAVRVSIARRIPTGRAPWEGERLTQRVLALVGPTGVGKTTTIAKLAARALLDARLKVQLITVDTYRIGASEHIGRYGEIMGIPVHVARDAAGLRQAMGRAAAADLVLVDTAGRTDPNALAAQAQLLRTVPSLEVHLVLSAASGPREMAAAARRYRDYRPSHLVFSKLDEADGPGGILSAASVVNGVLSCLADGQRVPDDLHAASSARVADLVLGT